MEQKKTANENLFSKAYKTFFFTDKEKELLDKGLKTNEILDKNNGIFNVSESPVFNFNGKDNIFKNKTVLNSSIETGKKQNLSLTSNIFDAQFFKNLRLNKGEPSPQLGNNFDQIG
ncbi:MAG TPA: hypothetical protein P5556_11225 [Candidatus Gastranaerophilales bacterium]|nr:hypothetical protein [Candidatus Gastranaerophilales bacterium]